MARRRKNKATGHELFPGFGEVFEIGIGSLATVFRARELDTGRLVALKLLNVRDASPRAIESFERESVALGSLSSHPNIVTLFRTFRTGDGRPVLVLELCSGAVADRLRGGQGLSVRDAVSIGIKVAGALETAHRGGILHRDVKPQNILMTEFGEPALADFGVAMLQSSTQTTAGLFDFTTLHAAPELLEGGGTSAATDVYELASSLYQLVAGQSAFRAYDGESPASVILRILRDPVRPLMDTGVPVQLSDLLIRAMSKDKDKRPPTAAEFAAELADVEVAQGWPRTQFLIRGPATPSAGWVPDIIRLPGAMPRTQPPPVFLQQPAVPPPLPAPGEGAPPMPMPVPPPAAVPVPPPAAPSMSSPSVVQLPPPAAPPMPPAAADVPPSGAYPHAGVAPAPASAPPPAPLAPASFASVPQEPAPPAASPAVEAPPDVGLWQSPQAPYPPPTDGFAPPTAGSDAPVSTDWTTPTFVTPSESPQRDQYRVASTPPSATDALVEHAPWAPEPEPAVSHVQPQPQPPPQPEPEAAPAPRPQPEVAREPDVVPEPEPRPEPEPGPQWQSAPEEDWSPAAEQPPAGVPEPVPAEAQNPPEPVPAQQHRAVSKPWRSPVGIDDDDEWPFELAQDSQPDFGDRARGAALVAAAESDASSEPSEPEAPAFPPEPEPFEPQPGEDTPAPALAQSWWSPVAGSEHAGAEQYPIPPSDQGPGSGAGVPTWAVRASAPQFANAAPQFVGDISIDPQSLRPKLTVRSGLARMTVDEDSLVLKSMLRRERMPWSQVSGFEPHFPDGDNGPMSKGLLVALTPAGAIELPATRRLAGELRHVHALLDAYRVRAQVYANR